MGMFTRLSHEGKVYQFKTGWDDLLTVRQGDTIPWEPDPRYPGEHIDGVYPACDDNGEERLWVIIKGCRIVAACRIMDGDTAQNMRERCEIQPPPRELWSELAWARKALRDARSEVDRLLWAQQHPNDNTGAGLYIHRRLREPSFMEKVFPPWDEAKLSDEQRLIADMLRVGDSMAPALGLEACADHWRELASRAHQLLQSTGEEQQEREEMARIMMWATEWVDIDEDGDSPYLQGARETIGHMLACWLTQYGGWDCYGTGEATGLIPWDEVHSWDVERWREFLKEQSHPGDGGMSISDLVNDFHRLDMLPPEDPLEYHRDAYGVPARVGVRVTMKDKPGVIKGASGPHVLVLFDGERKPVPCHPTWEMTYHEEKPDVHAS